MPSTYSTNLRFELMATGEKSGTWGTISNTNIGTLIEQAISGVASVTHDDSASYSLTTGNGTSDEARNAVVVVTGTLTAARNLVVPSVDKLYVIKNSTSGGFNITVKTSAGTGVVVENGNTKVVFCDATNVEEAITEVDLNKLTASNVDITGDLDVDNININGNTISSTDTNGNIFLQPNGTGDTIINDSGADSDFRVEGDTSPHMLFVDAGNNRIGINESAPDAKLHITTGDNSTQLKLESTDGDATVGPRMDFVRNSASPADNDTLGGIRFRGENSASEELSYAEIVTAATDVTDATEDGRIEFLTMQAGSLVSSAKMQSGATIFNESSNDIDFRVESSTQSHMLFVDAGNNRVGINQSSPSYNFDVNGDVKVSSDIYLGSQIIHDGDTDTNMSFGTDDITFTVGNHNAIKMSSGTTIFNEDSQNRDFRVESNNATHAFFVDAGGDDVCIGKSTVDLSTNGFGFANINTVTTYMALTNTSSSSTAPVMYCNRHSGDGQNIVFRRSNSTVGNVSVTSSGTTYNTSSDRRLKTDINPIADATEKLMAMNPVTHKWIAEPDGDAVHGFIAQDMQGIVPEAVSGDPEGEDMMAMDYGRITPILVAALQESNKKIEQLEARIVELEAK